MGTLKPGASYIYERVGDTVYGRIAGTDPSTRIIVGSSITPNTEYATTMADQYFMEMEWKEIIRSAKDNPTLQAAIDRVKILYHLSKNDGQE